MTDPIVVSPDVGGVVRARAVAKQLDDAELAIIDKRRPRANEAQVMNIIGEVRGRTCVIVDDIADTAGTLCQGARALKQRGAERVYAYCTHAVLSEPAVDNLEQSELDELVVTDTIPLDGRARECPPHPPAQHRRAARGEHSQDLHRPLGRGALHGVGRRGAPRPKTGPGRPRATLPDLAARQPTT